MARTTPAAAKASAPAPADPAVPDMQALIAAAVAAAIAGIAPAAAPVEAAPAPVDLPTSVDSRTPEGQPTLKNPTKNASIPQKRLWADLLVRAARKKGDDGKPVSTAAKLKALDTAETAYLAALHGYMLAAGITSPSTVTMIDAQVSISALKA